MRTRTALHKGFLFLSIIGILFSFYNAQQIFAAGPPVHALAGNQAMPVRIDWNVVGGSGTCYGSSLDYPNISDNVISTWQKTQLNTGFVSFTKIYANPGTYTFICKDTISTAQDSITLIVDNPCNASQTWDQTTASCKANSNPPATAPILSSPSTTVDHNNPATIPVWTCPANATSNTVNGISVPLNGPYTTPNLTTSTTYSIVCKNADGDSPASTFTVNVASGSFTAPPSSCEIARNASSCTATFAWSSTNAGSINLYNATLGTTLSTAPSSGGLPVTISYPSNTIQLRNGTYIYVGQSVSANCASGDTWSTSSGTCVASTCTNSAINPTASPRCTQCTTGQYWDTSDSTCKSCSNGGCNGSGGSQGNPLGGLSCANGSTGGVPACPPPIYGSCNTTHYSCTAGNSSSNNNLSDRWTWYCAGQYGGTDSSTCTEMKPNPTGTLNANGVTRCDITVNNSTCDVALYWTTTDPITTSKIYNGATVIYTANNSPASGVPFPVSKPSSTFTLKNNGNDLATVNISAKCQDVLYEDAGGVCRACAFGGCDSTGPGVRTCKNGARNEPTCDTCYDGNYWDTGSNSCKVCGDTGCDGAGGSQGNPNGGLTCKNGATNVPTCTPPPAMTVGSTFTVSTPNSSHIVNGTSGTTATNIASNGEIARFRWLAITGATSCTMNGIAISTSGGTSDVTVSGWPGLSKAFTFICSNAGKTITDTITVSYPAAPTSPSLSCAVDGESATANWTSAGLSTYTTQAYEKVGTGAQTEITDPAIKKDGYSGPTSLTFTIDPKGPLASPNTSTYTVKIYSQASNGALSAESSIVKQCARPLPTVNLSATTANGGTSNTSVSAYYDEPGSSAYLAWTTAGNVTSCTLKHNNVTVSTTLTGSNPSYPLPAGDTKNNLDTQYDLICYNSTGSTSKTVHVIVPPKPPTGTGTCPAPGTSATVTWSYPSGYSRGYYNIIKNSEHTESPLTCGGKPSDVCGSHSSLTSKTITTLLDESYTWWIRTEHPSNANYSEGTGDSFTCAAPDIKAGNILTGLDQLTTETMVSTPFTAYINNRGSQSTGSSFKAFLQVSQTYDGGVVGPYTDVTPAVTIRTLAANGDFETFSSSYSFPSAGKYGVRVCADKSNSADSGTITESDEGNNCGPWAPVTIQSLPKVTMDPSANVDNHYPKTPLTISSTATDADGNMTEHMLVVEVNGHKYNDTSLPASEGTVVVSSGTLTDKPGPDFSPLKSSNSYTTVLTPSHPGTYIVTAQAKESIYTSYITKQITVTVACHNDEWWKVSDCVKSTADISLKCSNGALNPSTCDRCAPTDVFYNGRCINAGLCYAEHRNLRPFTCGDGVVDSGEECDGTAGLSNPATQKCTNKCTITCATGASTLNGAPSCGAGADKVFSANNEKVAACTNGALQSSAPTCNVCPNGETANTVGNKIVCKAPVCGNGTTDRGTTEECDGTDNVTSGKFCTSNCCLVNTQPPLSQTEQIPEYTLTCENSDSYQILNSAGSVVKQGVFIDTNRHDVVFKPTTKDTYTYKCLYSLSSSVKSEKIATTILPNATSSATGRTSLNISPKSISKNSSVTLSWITTYPDNQCSIRAIPVITKTSATCNEDCIAARFREVNRINSDLRLGVTDANDLGTVSTPRNILTAMQTEAVSGGGKAIGKKTLNLNYSTIFYASCSANPIADPSAAKVKVSVVGDSEN